MTPEQRRIEELEKCLQQISVLMNLNLLNIQTTFDRLDGKISAIDKQLAEIETERALKRAAS